LTTIMDVTTLQGVIFDLDGTLVDSHLDFDRMRQHLGFPAGQPVLEHLATLTDPQEISVAEDIIAEHEMQGAHKAKWMPGAQAFLGLLKQLHLPIGILTRNMREATEYMVSALDIPVDIIVTREDCVPKPSPDGLLYIARQWGLHVSSLVYVGDYLFDIQAAKNANMLSCLYRNYNNAHFADQADWAIHHFDELTQAFVQQCL